MKSAVAVIIDGTSTAVSYAPTFRSYGIDCIHIYSSKVVQEKFSHTIHATDYVAMFEYEGDVELLLAKLVSFHILAVLAGVDSGIELQDLLNERLGLKYSNEASTSLARFHKFTMTERVSRSGLLAPEQFVSADKKELMQWIKNRNCFPIILKPTNSAGATGVFKCNSLKESKHYIDVIKNMKSFFGANNSAIVVQEYLTGQEYIVDAVSLNGKHKIINLWKVIRDNGSSPVLDGMVVVEHSQEQYQPIIAYAKEVFGVLGVQNGPSHLELIQTQQGPSIIELNARPHGSLNLRLPALVNGYDQLHDVVESILCPYHFVRKIHQPPVFHGYCAHILIRSGQKGRLASLDIWEKFAQLKTYIGCKVNCRIGQTMEITRDLSTALGSVSLYSESYEELMADWQTIRVFERFIFEDRPPPILGEHFGS